MRLRARHIHHIEILIDNIIGVAFNFWLCQLVLYILNVPFTYGENAILTIIIFITTYIRRYITRRTFSNWIQRIYERRKLEEQTGED